jgi:hypothetical protein
VRDEMNGWREDLDPKIEIVHAMASEFGAVIVPFDQYLNNLVKSTPISNIAEDGIHPSAFAHSQMAQLWLKSVALS